jgi:hypothetical protein
VSRRKPGLGIISTKELELESARFGEGGRKIHGAPRERERWTLRIGSETKSNRVELREENAGGDSGVEASSQAGGPPSTTKYARRVCVIERAEPEASMRQGGYPQV